jgi:hypothetical protein
MKLYFLILISFNLFAQELNDDFDNIILEGFKICKLTKGSTVKIQVIDPVVQDKEASVTCALHQCLQKGKSIIEVKICQDQATSKSWVVNDNDRENPAKTEEEDKVLLETETKVKSE